LASGDFNEDGKADLATANTDGNSVTVMLGDGAADPSFPSTAELPVAEYPYSVVTTDLNGDGHADLATGHYYDYISLLLGDGNGGFTEAPGSPVNVGGMPYSLAVDDFNGDGKPDLATVDGSSSDVRVLLGDGAGGFTPAPGSPYQAGSNGSSVIVSSDFNGDSKRDLAIPRPSAGDVWILLGDGAGSFTGSAVTVDASRPYWLAVADVNADTKPDLVTANDKSGTVSVLLGDGAAQPTFTATAASPIATGGSYPTGIAVDDVDRDGKTDTVVVNQNSNNVSVLIGDGAGGLAPTAGSPFDTGGADSYSLALADMNGDARIDLVTGNYSSSNVTVLLNEAPSEPPTTTTTESPTTTTTEPAATTTTQPGATTTTTTTGPSTTTTQSTGPTTTTMPPTTTTTSDPTARPAGAPASNAEPAGPTTEPAMPDRRGATVGEATAAQPGGRGASLAATGRDVRHAATLGAALVCLGALLTTKRR
jgi:hypothetical protein